MENKGKKLITKTLHPFEESAQTRLVNMGIITRDGKLNQVLLPLFAVIFTGLFFDDMCNYYSDADDLSAIYKCFVELYEKEDYQQMYLFFAVQYDNIKKSLPDPVWWIAGNEIVVKAFMTCFLENYRNLMIETGFINIDGEDD